MSELLSIPELRVLDGPAHLIRIPNQIDVPVTPRLMRLIDTAEFQRLTRISQLGLVAAVYPAAHHKRFEHSLGVYRMTLLFLRQLASSSRFCNQISGHDAEVLLVSALLHDIGHWPFCHPIEDIRLEDLPSHESFAENYIADGSIAEILSTDWNIDASEVMQILRRDRSTPVASLLTSILSGPIDVDKMDYLYRDSLHAGVPYGQNFDSARLIRSLCVNEAGDELAITHKGRTAAELMVISRYTMFSEVYWHHAVRSATAMFQRAFYHWYCDQRDKSDFGESLDQLLKLDETGMVQSLRESVDDLLAGRLLDGLFGSTRRLYKRLAHYSFLECPSLYQKLAHQSYDWLVGCGDRLAAALSRQAKTDIKPGQILIDAPPVGLEVQFDVDVYYDDQQRFRKLGEVSPLVNTLAQHQFDDHVKQVRVFADPDVASKLHGLNLDDMLEQAIET